jgi:cytochrome-b5 reductase
MLRSVVNRVSVPRLGASITTAARQTTLAMTVATRGSRSDSSRSDSMRRVAGMVLVGSCTLVATSLMMYSTARAAEKPKDGLDPKEFKKFRLREVKPYNHNSSIFVFDLASPDAKLDMPVASFVLAKTVIDGKDVVRPYTPIDQHTTGTLNLLVKKYEKGNMSKHIHSLKAGDQLELKGPMPKLKYTPNMKKEIGMIAGGSGITPMLQVATEVLSNPADKTKVTLVFANVTEGDILLRERLDALAAKHPNLTIHYVLDKAPNSAWKGHVGFVDAALIKKLLPPPSKDTLILVCGPPPMMAAVSGDKAKDYSQGPIAGALAKLNYQQEHVFKF